MAFRLSYAACVLVGVLAFTLNVEIFFCWFCWGFGVFWVLVGFLWFLGCHILFVILIRIVVASGTGCTESPLEEGLAAPCVAHEESGLFQWILQFLARLESCCKELPEVRSLIAGLLLESSFP